MSSIPEPKSEEDEERWIKVGENAKRVDPGLRQVALFSALCVHAHDYNALIETWSNTFKQRDLILQVQ